MKPSVYYGESAGYTKTPEGTIERFVRALLGCISPSIAGEPIEEEETKALNNIQVFNDGEHEHSFEKG